MTPFDDDDKALLQLKPCDAIQGYSTLSFGTYYHRICPLCGFQRLREVFSHNKLGLSRERIQCPHCGARTFDVSLDFGSADPFWQFRRGWFWPSDEEGYPVFANGKRVTPNAL